MRIRLLWVALLCWAAGILWLSSLSPQQLPDAAHLLWDKINHVVAFALGGWLAVRALRGSWPSMRPSAAFVAAVVAISVFGVIDETVQGFTPGRQGGDAADWAADTLGAIAGAALGVRRGLPRSRLPR